MTPKPIHKLKLPGNPRGLQTCTLRELRDEQTLMMDACCALLFAMKEGRKRPTQSNLRRLHWMTRRIKVIGFAITEKEAKRSIKRLLKPVV